MSLFNLSSTLRGLRCGLASLIVLGTLSACQVKPLYSESSPVSQNLGSIGISEANTRVGQEVRNQLIFLTSGGAGEPSSPRYNLALQVSSTVIGALYDQAGDTPQAGRIVVYADFNLTEASTGKTLKSGRRSSVALVDFPTQEFAKVRAIRDGENRAARELAEMIRGELALVVSR
ncbi:hypothetical protein IFT84_19740 [Rhizobium sp. CFBP 8762]|uniref:hypothetical protein n=1 Tax=Rhizobium sp. CFBP 8762 TaxID=2775279 RepID=UPI001781BC77|nr:hypothetical protein [Rhizobium sp. CFBP 8762]MBD8556747.1 hypothetical protein [Rhizobium sp. CFBP 8762]